MGKDQIVEAVAHSIVWWIGNRRKKLADLRSESMAINPFLAPLMLSLGDITSFDELAHLLLAGHFSTGHATGFGKLVDEKVLPHAFKTTKLDAAFRRNAPWSSPIFDEIDHVVRRADGRTYLLCLKAGRWTIQLTMAVQLNHAFVRLIEARSNGEVEFDGIVVGAFYGTTAGLTDKYDILRGINRGARHDVADVRRDVTVYAGREFWTWLNDGEADTQEWVMEGILCGIALARQKHGPVTDLMATYKREFAQQFRQHVKADQTIDWMAILRMING